MTFLKCSIRGKKHGEKAVDELPMEQVVATGQISRATTPQPEDASPTSDQQVQYTHVHVIVVAWFLQCMGYVPREGCMYFRGRSPKKYIQHEGGTIPCHVKRFRPYKANYQISFSARMSILQCIVCTVHHLYRRTL